ncbi:efflux RND transporter periplasmic adaptor subunit [bacterium]|nr:efflux RND transporter periplasmic adaptor subunit [bacterium]
MKKLIWTLVILLVLGGSFFFVKKLRSNDDKSKFTTVAVEKGAIVEKALAIGSIGPKHEIVVKSQVSGIVETVNKEVGEVVNQGEPLITVKPEPTPVELANGRRELELTTLDRENASRELNRATELLNKSLLSQQEFDQKKKAFEEAKLREAQRREQLELMEKGSSKIGNVKVESIIRSPVTGTILERLVNLGDPVVPLTTYQPGTELMKLADMEDLIFMGTVDEIDVGKLTEGMEAKIYIGALPKDTLTGELYFISPKSRTKDNANVFDLKIKITDRGDCVLRAGYSANADVIVRQKDDVATLPERLIKFRNDSAFVKVVATGTDTTMEKFVKVGLSDGLKTEIVEGLVVGDSVVEEATKEIE